MSVSGEHPFAGRSGNGHFNCLMCGARNPWSLGLDFELRQRGEVWSLFQAHEGLQGYDGILHGGVISGLLDAAMTHCLFHHGVHAVTADLRVRFLRPIPYDALLEVTARLVSAEPPVYRAGADIVCDGHVMASARARFTQCSPAQRAAVCARSGLGSTKLRSNLQASSPSPNAAATSCEK
jgi:uncharacterized protein (TIGR00369 family)